MSDDTDAAWANQEQLERWAREEEALARGRIAYAELQVLHREFRELFSKPSTQTGTRR